jgi:hypothetical protein
MSFSFGELFYIISRIDDLLIMADPCRDIVISADSSMNDDDDDDDELVLKLSFLLKNGYSKVLISEDKGLICYYSHNHKLIQKFEFSDDNIYDMNSSFSKVLRKIILLDRSSKQPERHDVVLSPTHGGS